MNPLVSDTSSDIEDSNVDKKNLKCLYIFACMLYFCPTFIYIWVESMNMHNPWNVQHKPWTQNAAMDRDMFG